MLFLSLNSSLEYCFTLPDIRGMFIPGKKRIGLSIADMDVAELRGA